MYTAKVVEFLEFNQYPTERYWHIVGNMRSFSTWFGVNMYNDYVTVRFSKTGKYYKYADGDGMWYHTLIIRVYINNDLESVIKYVDMTEIPDPKEVANSISEIIYNITGA